MLKTYSANDKLFTGHDYFSYQKLNLIKLYFLHKDLNCPFFEKEILLYNHEALNHISSVAIATESFIFVNENIFNDLFYSYRPSSLELSYLKYLNEEKDMIINGFGTEELLDFNLKHKEIKETFNSENINSLIENIPVVRLIKHISEIKNYSIKSNILNNLILNPIVYLSNENLLKYLNESNLLKVSSTLDNEIKNSHKSFLNFESRLDFSKQHKEYLLAFKNKTLPSFIFNYNSLLIKKDLENADNLLDYFIKTTCNEVKSFSSLSFALTVYLIFNHDLFDTYNTFINKNSFKTKGIHLINQTLDLDLEERNYLISCGSGLSPSDFYCQLIPENKIFKPLKKI